MLHYIPLHDWDLEGESDAGVAAAQDLSIEVSKGQSLLVVGHSGCGKSSLLRAIAGEPLHTAQHALSLAALQVDQS